MKPEGARPVTVIPVTLPVANKIIESIHRHHGAIPAGFVWFCVAAVVDKTVRGVAVAGRPTNRNNDDGQTVEVLRVAVDGTINTASALLGACANAAKAMGAHRVITYTLDSESGSSLRGAGWTCEAQGIQSSWMTPTPGRNVPIARDHFGKKKARWAKHFRPGTVAYTLPHLDQKEDEPSLFTVGGDVA